MIERELEGCKGGNMLMLVNIVRAFTYEQRRINIARERLGEE